MPDSISVAAFVIGLVLVVAALIGKKISIAAMELPALSRAQRSIVGILGCALVTFGLFEGQWPTWPASVSLAATAAPADTTSASAEDSSGECFADVAKANRVEIGVETARRTDMRFTSGQPREAVFALQFTSAGNFVGGVKLKSLVSGVGFDILSVVDNACTPITTYENASRPNQPQNAPYTFDTLHYHFGQMVIAVEIFYKDDGQLELHAQPIAP